MPITAHYIPIYPHSRRSTGNSQAIFKSCPLFFNYIPIKSYIPLNPIESPLKYTTIGIYPLDLTDHSHFFQQILLGVSSRLGTGEALAIVTHWIYGIILQEYPMDFSHKRSKLLKS